MQLEKKIRRRNSYKKFYHLTEQLLRNQPGAALDIIYQFLNNKHAFGSRTNSRYALESIQQIKSDLGI